MISAEMVKDWFKNSEDTLYDLDLEYSSEGDDIELEDMPSEYKLKVVVSNTERDYDSYGYQSVDGYIVFSVTDSAGESENFKLPVSYASFEGWAFDINGIAPTVQKEKVVTYWEWV